VALRIRGDQQIYEPISQFETAQNKFVSIPIDLGPPTDQVILVLFGTGIRRLSSATKVSAKLGEVEAPVLYAGPAPGFVGVDQINLAAPRSLIGRGEVDVLLMIDAQSANLVRVNLK